MLNVNFEKHPKQKVLAVFEVLLWFLLILIIRKIYPSICMYTVEWTEIQVWAKWRSLLRKVRPIEIDTIE